MINTSSITANIKVPQNSNYSACAPGQLSMCEPGATASGPNPNGPGSVDLTNQILSCPPDSCIAYGCPGYEFYSVGLEPCGVNTSAPIGSSFTVNFVLIQLYGSQVYTVTVSRTINVVAMCSKGQYQCGSPPVCLTVPCAVSSSLSSLSGLLDNAPPPPDLNRPDLPVVSNILPIFFSSLSSRTFAYGTGNSTSLVAPGPWSPDVEIPSISKRRSLAASGMQAGFRFAVALDNSSSFSALGANSTLTSSWGSLGVAFGRQLPFPLQTCATAPNATANLSQSSCGVWASSSSGDDFSSLILADSSAVASTGLSFQCNLASAQSGQCLPGIYRLSFIVLSSLGTSRSSLLLSVEQRRILRVMVIATQSCDTSSLPDLSSDSSLFNFFVSSKLNLIGIDLSSVRNAALVSSAVKPWPLPTSVGLCWMNVTLDVEIACVPVLLASPGPLASLINASHDNSMSRRKTLQTNTLSVEGCTCLALSSQNLSSSILFASIIQQQGQQCIEITPGLPDSFAFNALVTSQFGSSLNAGSSLKVALQSLNSSVTQVSISDSSYTSNVNPAIEDYFQAALNILIAENKKVVAACLALNLPGSESACNLDALLT